MLANLVTFLVLMGATEYAARENKRAISADYTEWLADQLDEIVDRDGAIRIGKALNWRGWRRFDDVIVAQMPEEAPPARTGAEGRRELVVPGVFLNPLGRAERAPDFDEQNALQMILDAAAAQQSVSTAFGTAAPIGLPGAKPWGGVWFRRKEVDIGDFPHQQLTLIFVATMALFTALILWLLQRTVLDPVRHLAGVVGHLESANLRARVNIPEGRNDEIAELGHGFNAMAGRLQRYNLDLQNAVEEATARVKAVEAAAMTQRRLAATGELAAGVAHELNNPLGGLSNAVEALGRDSLSPERRKEYLSLVSSGLARMGETVGRLLRLAPRETLLEGVTLLRPLGDALGLVRHRAEAMGVAIDVSGPGEAHGPRSGFEPGALDPFATLPQIRGAANELGQALLNLFVNALDAIEEARGENLATKGPGRILLTMETGADHTVQIVCADDGPGVVEEVMDRVADAFFTTKEQGKGTGLGLAIVHNVVAAHGGRVLLESSAGMGFSVTIELPAETTG
ncbi:Sporulation kinase A [Planctomycetes bacterium Poly30]|uniref:histidine kinase n=1 Tax=Saltatorellus ferox TaxID=2528018 RepID=A0A518EU81_9BACT|nr:Sporulation kinase A [Planctomycetes bacterium Poly30]